jgi:4-hydroxy-tetrahydrodipicolinate reductase
MGQALVRCSRRLEGVAIAGAVETAGHAALGRDAGIVAGIGELGVKVTDDLRAAIAGADAVIDFSVREAAPANVRAAAELRRAYVLGTTGLNDGERAAVQRAAQTVPIVWAPNMSLAVNLLFALVEKAAGVLGPDYDIEIVEMHHRFKKDAPSGTAANLLEILMRARELGEQDLRHGRHGITGERTQREIGVHALRGGDVVGEHTVMFAALGERVEITHKATDRAIFARGALHAARWVFGRAPGLYDMHDVLGFRKAPAQ